MQYNPAPAPRKSIIDGTYWHAYCAIVEWEPVEPVNVRKLRPGTDCEGCGHEV